MTDLPTGTVTFLFTDVEGSTKLLHELGAEAYDEALIEHRRVLREAFGRHDGVEVDTQGDAFFYAFPTATGALQAASEGQSALAAGRSPCVWACTPARRTSARRATSATTSTSVHGSPLRPRRTGRALESDTQARGARADRPREHRLKDIPAAVPIFQLGDDRFPPLKTISNTNLPTPASSFGAETRARWRCSLASRRARALSRSRARRHRQDATRHRGRRHARPRAQGWRLLGGACRAGDPSLVSETIAQTLGAKDGLAEHIGEREMLLLLDNLEQVIEAAPELGALVSACSNLTLLVTIA